MSSSPSKDQVAAELVKIVHKITGVDARAAAPPGKLAGLSFTDDLDIDSLSMVEVMVAAEERFEVAIPDEAIRGLKTVGDAAAYIAKRLAAGTAPNQAGSSEDAKPRPPR